MYGMYSGERFAQYLWPVGWYKTCSTCVGNTCKTCGVLVCKLVSGSV